MTRGRKLLEAGQGPGGWSQEVEEKRQKEGGRRHRKQKAEGRRQKAGGRS